MHYQYPRQDFPDILHPEDLDKMSIAAAAAAKRLAREGAVAEYEAVARLVVQLYRRGLVDPEKLADVAVMFGHSKLFSSRP